jgi:hypothetical protein
MDAKSDIYFFKLFEADAFRTGSSAFVAVLVTREKRRRAAALQNAKRLPATCGLREASWTAPALWRFDRRSRQTGGLLHFLHHQHLDGFAVRDKFQAEFSE